MPTKAQLRRWRSLKKTGYSYRDIARLETQAHAPISYTSIRRALTEGQVSRTTATRHIRLCTMDRVAQCAATSERLLTLCQSPIDDDTNTSLRRAARRLAGVHLGMPARDAMAIVRETQRDVLSALGFPRL